MSMRTALHLNVREARLKGRPRTEAGPDEESLSPNLQPPSPPLLAPGPLLPLPCQVGPYLITGPAQGSSLLHCVHLATGEHLVCKVVETSGSTLTALSRLSGHPVAANPVLESAQVGGGRAVLLVHRPAHGDLHSHVRERRRLAEPEARALFAQLVSAVAAAHGAGIVLRDLKLRKFVFADPQRTQLRLETLDDAVVVENGDDQLSDRHGCPAYVSPEILEESHYSGKAADCWSLGIMLYVMLVGRYPFHDADPPTVLARVKAGRFTIPDFLSPQARCLIRSLLRRCPAERMRAEEVLDHPWLRNASPLQPKCYLMRSPSDQLVPEMPMES